MENQAYISHVHLKGYKSIRDMSVDLLPGLNIIIGPNGSGKTNFLEFLMQIDFRMPYRITRLEIAITNSDGVTQIIIPKDEKSTIVTLKKDNQIVGEKIFYSNDVINAFAENGVSLNDKVVIESKYIYRQYNFIKADFDNQLVELFKLQEGKSTIEIYSKEQQQFIVNTISKSNQSSIYATYKGRWFNSASPDDFFVPLLLMDTGYISKSVEHKTLQFLSYLKKLTPIQDVRIKDSELKKNISKEEDTYFIEIVNFYKNIEFNLYKRWSNFGEMSDGTKRIFYLFFQVFYSTKEDVILLEEPELGIHPDQLYKLMDFLEEQSKEKQIIITTHSPEVLNILGKDELDRIIITRYDDEKGTQMHHLSPKQIRKGQIYIEEVGNLKSFWVHSNLEEYEAE